MIIKKENISNNDYVICPYCSISKNNKFKILHANHLKIHNKNYEDLLKEFPNCLIVTKEHYENSKLKRLEGKRKKEKESKIVKCYYCKEEFEVNINISNNFSRCHNCKEKGLKCPIDRKYNKPSPENLEIGINKRKITCQVLYGGNAPACDINVREKMYDTMLELKNVKHALQNKDSLKKMEETNLRIYNYKCSLLNEGVKEKTNITTKKNWDEDHWAKSKKGKSILRKRGLELHLDRVMNEVKDLNLKLKDLEYQNSHYHHNWLCLKCNNIFKTCWNNIQQGYPCPTCYPRTAGTSIGELEVFEFIKSLNIFKNIENPNRKIIKPLHLDIYIPEKKLAIEYDGLRWHSEEWQDNCLNNNHPYDSKTYHLYKTEKCEEQDIQLIHIFEDEWIFKRKIVKSRLKQILGANLGTRIHARECIIKEISPKRKNEFLEEFHIQGHDSSRIKLGAFYNDKLVSVMTFSKGNISKGSKHREGVWELNRFCSDSNFHIPGIAGKLLSHFKKNYQWNEIFSYADRRWSMGNLYYKLGFELISISRPNYWYVKLSKYKRIHRFTLRKRPDEPKEISERILRLKEGYGIIWDCGNLKFQLVNSEK